MTASTGQRIQQLRRHHDMCQLDLAIAVSARGLPWTQQLVSLIEHGERKLTFDEAWVLANVFRCEMAEMHPENGDHINVRVQIGQRSKQAARGRHVSPRSVADGDL